MKKENAEMLKQGIGIKSIIKDYTKLRDWELKLLVDKEYEDAMLEQARREKHILIYQMPDGDWAASAEGIISNGFSTKTAAQNWVKATLRKGGWQQINIAP